MTSYSLRRPWSALPEIGPNGLAHYAEMGANGLSRCLPGCPACFGVVDYPTDADFVISDGEPVEPETTL